jgi:hypothetical protein
MSDWSPEREREEYGENAPLLEGMLAVPLPLVLRRAAGADVPDLGEEVVCLETVLDGRVIVRGAFRESLAPRIMAALAGDRVPVALRVHGRSDGGLDAHFFALVTLPDLGDSDDANAPWRASLPQPSFEEQETEAEIVPLPLGIVLRLPQDRRFGEDIAAEVADLVRAVLAGKGVDPMDKFLGGIL